MPYCEEKHMQPSKNTNVLARNPEKWQKRKNHEAHDRINTFVT